MCIVSSWKGYAKVAAPLHDMLRKGCLDELSAPPRKQLKFFLDLKHVLLNPLVLRLPQYGKVSTIDVDVRKGQLECALLHK